MGKANGGVLGSRYVTAMLGELTMCFYVHVCDPDDMITVAGKPSDTGMYAKKRR